MQSTRHARVFLLSAVAMFSASSRADMIVDTGAGGTTSVGQSALFNTGSSYQYLAGQFNLSQGAVVDQLSGWLGPNSAGNLNVKIYSNVSGLPGAELYSKPYSAAFRSTAGWEAFSGFNAPLPAGTYWMALEPTAGGYSGTMPGGAPSPLAKYAFNSNGNNRYFDLGAKALGMRVEGRSSLVSMGAAARGTTKQDTPINGNPDGLFAQTGGNGSMSANANVGDGAGRGAVSGNGLEVGAFARGFNDAPGGPSQHSGVGTGHGVAWRPYYNSSSQPVTFKINAVLDGAANNSFGNLNCNVDARISALDPEKLSQLVGGDAATYLLDRHTSAGSYAAFPGGTAITDKVLTDQFVADSSGNQPKTYNISTNLFTVQPGEGFVMLFDVFVQTTGASLGGGQGTVDFLNTMRPAANLFTDTNGNAVTGIVPGSIQQIVPEPVCAMFVSVIPLLARRRRRVA